MWSITVEVSSLTVFHSKFTCAGLWATELDGRRWFVAAGGSWEFHIIISICSLMKTCKCEMQFQLKGLSKGLLHYRALVWYLHHLSPSRFFPGRGWHCWLLSRWLYLKYSHLINANILMKIPQESQQKSCVSRAFDDCKHFTFYRKMSQESQQTFSAFHKQFPPRRHSFSSQHFWRAAG